MLKAVARHTDQSWVLLYVARWLKAPMLMPDGTLALRVKGTPQGGPISPLIANIFLHCGLDMWMVREHPTVWFERFAESVGIRVSHWFGAGETWRVQVPQRRPTSFNGNELRRDELRATVEAGKSPFWTTLAVWGRGFEPRQLHSQYLPQNRLLTWRNKVRSRSCLMVPSGQCARNLEQIWTP